jgi:uncharacterized protein (DUF1499 family)
MKDTGNKLTPCPSSPNCVSSLSEDRKHAIEPLQYTGSRDEARNRLVGILDKQAAARVTINETDYIHAEFRSQIFRFVDDVEFLFSDEEKIIHVKSASRIGYSDLGANRKRVEWIRRVFEVEGTLL